MHLTGPDGEVDPLEDLLAGHAGAEPADLEHVARGHSTTTSTSPSTTRASYTGTGRVAGSDVGSPVSSEKELPCFQHSRVRSSAEHVALGERDVLVAAAVADGVDVVAEAHQRDHVAAGLHSVGLPFLELVQGPTRTTVMRPGPP